MTTATPPRWAETLLRSVLSGQDRDTISGDLLEEYRERIHPERGEAAAYRWYIAQVAGYVVRSNTMWVVLFASASVGRQAYDWFVPTTDFVLRSDVTTYVATGLVLSGGFWTAWRSGSMIAGPLAGFTITAISAAISVIGCGLLLAIWHDPATLAAIGGSGGLDEVFLLPIFMIGPGVMLGTVGGMVGAGARRIRLHRIDAV